MSITRGEVLTAAQDDFIGRETISTEQANRWFNQLEIDIREILDQIDPLRNVQSTTFSVSDSNDTGTIPSDFKHINAPELGFFTVDNDSDIECKLPQSGEGQAIKGYYLEGGTVYFTGFGNTETVKLKYAQSFTRKSSYLESDTLIVPDDFFEMAVEYIKYRHYEQQNDPKMNIAYAMYEDKKEELESQYRQNPSVVSNLNTLEAYG